MSIYNVASTLTGTVNRGADEDYTICRDNVVGHSATNNQCEVGQYKSPYPSLYYIYRGFLFFNTSELPDYSLISAATIVFNGIDDTTTTNFNIILRSAENVGDSLVVGDYAIENYSGDDLGELTTNPPTITDDYLHFTLNSHGIEHINTAGMTKFVLLSEEDINSSAPGGKEKVRYNIGATVATLYVTYTSIEPTETPTVTTINLACEDRQSTTLTAVGEVTDAGGGVTYRGFEYYEYTGGIYDSSMYAVREKGIFASTGEFRMTLSGLKPSTIYYIRAFAGNPFGMDYGDWVLCSTIAGSSYGIYEEANTATLCFYVRKVGGKWSIKHGPYTTDQSDIEITKILTEGSGKYQIKFESDVLTGISAGVMCKVDIKAR